LYIAAVGTAWPLLDYAKQRYLAWCVCARMCVVRWWNDALFEVHLQLITMDVFEQDT
jgi:hypothetical protein